MIAAALAAKPHDLAPPQRPDLQGDRLISGRSSARVGEKAMAGQMDEDVFQRGLAEGHRFDFVAECVDQLAHQFVSARPFDSERAVDQRRFEPGAAAAIFCASAAGASPLSPPRRRRPVA